MARKRRPRRYWPHWVVVALPIVGFRYDEQRHAYVLRRIGDERGPVIRDVRLRGRLVRVDRTGHDGPEEAEAEADHDAPSTATVAAADVARSRGVAGGSAPSNPMMAGRGSDPTGGGNARAPRRRRRRWPWIVGSVALLILVWVVFMALSLVRALQDSHSAQSAADTARAQLTSAGGGVLSTQSTTSLTQANQRVAALHSDLSSPALTPLTVLPWVGTQIRSARAVASSADTVSAAGAQALNQANAALAQPHGPGPGRVALLQRLASIADTARNSLVGLDTGPSSGLVGTLSHRRAQLVTDISKAQDGLYRSSAAAKAAADLLSGSHQYLVLAANNAEMRAGSGIFLQGGILTTGGGRMQLGPLRSTGPQVAPDPGAPVPPDFFARWGQLRPGVFFANLAVNPQLNVTGPMAVQMWQGLAGQHVDGVMVLDIEALHQILMATGPVTTPDGTQVSPDNVVSLLMHGQYINASDPGEQTARREQLGSIARAAFDSANNRSSDIKALGTDLARASNGRHVMVWSDDPNDETLWQQAGVAGQLQSQDLLAAVQNFGTNKLDWFLDESNTLAVHPAQGASDLSVTLHLHNRVPPGEASYIAGPATPIDLGTPPTSPGPYGQYSGMVSVNLPISSSGVTVDGYTPAQIATSGPEGPTNLVAVRVKLQPGESQVVTIHFRMPGEHGQLRVVPAARVPDVSWNGQDSFTETGVHTVHW